MKDIKLIALDLDGTLFNRAGQITPATKEQLNRVAAQGVKIVISTGRPFNGLPFEQIEDTTIEYALTTKQRLNHTIYLPEINAFTIGELLYFFEMETAFAGELLEVNTYNQPGVENGKNATYALLGRKGYEAKKAELNSAPAKKEEYSC